MKESIQAYSKQKSLVKKALRQAGFTNIKMNNGYYYFSGFAERNSKLIYFSIFDVRHIYNSSDTQLLIRTAEHHKDFTGGSNHYATLDVRNIMILALQLIGE